MTRTGRAVAAGAMALALTLGACSGEEAPPAQDPTTPAATEEPATDEEDDAEDDAGGAGVRDLDAVEVVAEASYTLPGTSDEVTVGVLPLEAEGDVMTLRLAFTPNFASVSDSEPVAVFDMYPNNSQKFQPVLIDRENLKEYSLISETGQNWAANGLDLTAVNGDTTYWWGVYAAPEDDIETFDLRLRDGLPEFTDVPVR